MDQLRFGRQFRALRIRLRRRQADVAVRSGLSRSLIASIDRGQLTGVTIGAVVRAASALGANVDLRLRFRGEQLDRLLDEDHARLVEAVVRRLTTHGWSVEVEASFSIWGERGSIDILAFHPVSESVLVVEVKSVVPDSQSTLHGLDRKARLAPAMAADRGWRIGHVSRLLVIRDTSTSRRRIQRLEATYGVALPVRGRALRAWLRHPDRPVAGLHFLPDDRQDSIRRRPAGRERVNRPRRRGVRVRSRSDDDVADVRQLAELDE